MVRWAVVIQRVCVVVVAHSVILAQSEPRVRELPFDPSHPIASRLLPNDEVVTIRNDGETGLSVVSNKKLTVRQVIEDAAVGADLVVVLDVEITDGVLAQHDTWVNTRPIGLVSAVLRTSKTHRVSRGQRIELQLPDGELMIGKVLVKAGYTQFSKQLTPHRSYLLFLVDGDGVLYPLHAPAMVQNGTLAYAWSYKPRSFEPPHPLQGLSLREVTAIVRGAKRSWAWGSDPPPPRSQCRIYCNTDSAPR